jgi:FkbM family methyltransferase
MRLPVKLPELAARLRNRIRYVPDVPRVYRNWWAWPLSKFGVDTILELRNGLRFNVRSGTTDLAVLNEAAMMNPYLKSGFVALPRDGVVMDVGANMGDFTMMAAAMCPGARVYAIEPMAEYITALERNRSLNRLTNVEIIKVALGGHEGEIDLSIAGAMSSSQFNGDAATERVRLTTLPQLMFDQGIESIDLLKMDCEGSEWEILPAAREVFPRIRQICMEFHPARGWTAEKLTALLRESGYEVRYTDSRSDSYLWARRVAVRTERAYAGP